MVKKSGSITETELRVLKVLWEQGATTVRHVAEHLYGRTEESEIGTVHSLLLRLEKKGYACRDRSSQPHLFAAGVSQVDLAGLQLEEMADKLADGSLAPFLTHLFNSDRLGKRELEQIRKLLDETGKKG